MHRLICKGLLILWLLAPAAMAAEPEPPPVVALLSDRGPVYTQFLQGLEASLRRSGQADRLQVRTGLNEAPVPEDALYLAVGTGACRSLLAEPQRRPLVCSLVPRLTFRQLLREAGAQPALEQGALTGVYLDQPFERQLELVAEVLPGVRVIGSLLGPASSAQRGELQAAADRAGYRLQTARIETGERDPLRALEKLLAESEVLLALPDPAVYNRYTIRPLLLETFHRNVPVIGFSHAYSRAGAMASLFTTPEQVGRQTGELLAAREPGGALPPPQYPRYFVVEINREVTDLLGYDPPHETEIETRLKRGKD